MTPWEQRPQRLWSHVSKTGFCAIHFPSARSHHQSPANVRGAATPFLAQEPKVREDTRILGPKDSPEGEAMKVGKSPRSEGQGAGSLGPGARAHFLKGVVSLSRALVPLRARHQPRFPLCFCDSVPFYLHAAKSIFGC